MRGESCDRDPILRGGPLEQAVIEWELLPGWGLGHSEIRIPGRGPGAFTQQHLVRGATNFQAETVSRNLEFTVDEFIILLTAFYDACFFDLGHRYATRTMPGLDAQGRLETSQSLVVDVDEIKLTVTLGDYKKTVQFTAAKRFPVPSELRALADTVREFAEAHSTP